MLILNTRRLIELRIRAGLSQRALAKRCGLSSAYLSQLERQERQPSPLVARKLCEALDVGFDELFKIVLPALDPTGTEGGNR